MKSGGVGRQGEIERIAYRLTPRHYRATQTLEVARHSVAEYVGCLGKHDLDTRITLHQLHRVQQMAHSGDGMNDRQNSPPRRHGHPMGCPSADGYLEPLLVHGRRLSGNSRHEAEHESGHGSHTHATLDENPSEYTLDIRLLGNVEIHHDGTVVTLPRAGERCVLATLAFNPGHRFTVDTLIDHMWGDDQPSNAEQTITTYTRAVRRALELAGGRRDSLRNHRPGAYSLSIDRGLVDYHRFTSLVAEAGAHRRAGVPAQVIAAYQKAVQLRNGEALANVTGQWAAHRRYAIEQEYLDALCAMYEEQLGQGLHAAVATSAIHLVTEITPTDRMVLLAAHGLAASGQRSMIPEFIRRASQRLWETAEAELSAEARAIADDLLVRGVQLSSPTVASAATNDRAANVVMTASNNAIVYQAAGDQHIIDGG